VLRSKLEQDHFSLNHSLRHSRKAVIPNARPIAGDLEPRFGDLTPNWLKQSGVPACAPQGLRLAGMTIFIVCVAIHHFTRKLVCFRQKDSLEIGPTLYDHTSIGKVPENPADIAMPFPTIKTQQLISRRLARGNRFIQHIKKAGFRLALATQLIAGLKTSA
jgi:hypothetical protein